MIKSLKRAGVGQYYEIGKIGLCFFTSTPLNAKLYTHERAEVVHLFPGECYSLPSAPTEAPAGKNSLSTSINRGP